MVSERIQPQIDGLLDEAEQAIRSHGWDVVRARAESVLRLDPGNTDALTFLEAAKRDFTVVGTESSNDATGPASSIQRGQVAATPFANGRYQVKEFLDEGGRKRVYKSHDTVLDRDVALAVIKTEGLDPTSSVRITRFVPVSQACPPSSAG